jgi:hypothetical protein
MNTVTLRSTEHFLDPGVDLQDVGQGPVGLKTVFAQPVTVVNCSLRVRYVVDGVNDAAPLKLVSMEYFCKNIVRPTCDNLT